MPSGEWITKKKEWGPRDVSGEKATTEPQTKHGSSWERRGDGRAGERRFQDDIDDGAGDTR